MILLNETYFTSALIDQIPFRIFGTFNRTMRKAMQVYPTTRFLPALPQTTSRKDLIKVQKSDAKENSNFENHVTHKIRIQPAHHCIPRKERPKNEPFVMEKILEKKLPEKERTDVPTQPKMNRPWIAKEIDLNKITARTSRMKSIAEDHKNSQILRRKSCQGATPESSINEAKLTTLEDETQKIPRQPFGRGGSLHRDKIYSCKIAMKKGVFPINERRFEQEKMQYFFQQCEKISTIKDKSQQQGSELFMSFESYLQMDL